MKTNNTVLITTAQKLSDAQRASLKKIISKKIGSTFELTEIVDPVVIGGVKIKLGEQEYDVTISGSLEKVDSILEVVEVTTADPLTQSQTKTLRSGLEQKLGRAFELVQKVDPSVLAGLRLRVGSKEFDGTIKKQLEKLSLKITNQL